MAKIKVFIDSDVIISSLLSETGAANAIVNNTDLRSFISNYSNEELDRIIDKLGVDKHKLAGLIKNRLKTVKLKLSQDEVLDNFAKYTYDQDDAHIIAGAKETKSKFLVTFNIKDYKIDKIYQNFDIRVILPGELLQYLRSIVHSK